MNINCICTYKCWLFGQHIFSHRCVMSGVCFESWSVRSTTCIWWIRIWCEVLGLCWDGLLAAVFQNNNSVWKVLPVDAVNIYCLSSYCEKSCCNHWLYESVIQIVVCPSVSVSSYIATVASWYCHFHCYRKASKWTDAFVVITVIIVSNLCSTITYHNIINCL